MSDPIQDWSWFDPIVNPTPREAEFDPLQLDRIAAQFFQTDDGAYLLRFLRAITMDRTLGPDASDGLLRHLEGQRQIIAQLIKMTQRGSNPSGHQQQSQQRN